MPKKSGKTYFLTSYFLTFSRFLLVKVKKVVKEEIYIIIYIIL